MGRVRIPGHANAGESHAVELALHCDEVLAAQRRRWRELNQLLGTVDKLAVELAVRIPRNRTARRHRRRRSDVPSLQSGRVEHVLMPASHEHYRVVRRHFVEIPPKWQSLLDELRLMPVVVAHDELTRFRSCEALGYFREQLVQAAHPRKVHTGTTTGIVQVPVSK